MEYTKKRTTNIKFNFQKENKLNYLKLIHPPKNNNDFFYPLAHQSWDQEEHNAIINQLYSGKLTMGENVKKFEKHFANYFGSKYCVMVNSGSSANLLIVAALTLLKKYNFEKGDEVLVPALGWSTSYSPFNQYGIKLRFLDIKKSTLNIDENIIEKAITKKTKAILAINILGNPVDFKRINQICNKHNLILIEDNCESLGAKFKSKYTGTFGVASSHSFYFSHHLQTIEGGMISTDDKDVYEFCKSLRSHGWTRELENNDNYKNTYESKFKNSFKFILPGYNVRPNEFNGILGQCQLRKFRSFLDGRKKNADFFKSLFKEKNFCQIQESYKESSWYGFSLVLSGNLKNKREYVINELIKERIETRPIVSGNFLKNPVEKYYKYSVYGELKNIKDVDENGFFVGNSHKDLKPQIQKLYEVLDNFHKKIN
ncbi:MAG: DegT/DnrJ/EryC1/StrS family aminotransferase [Pseudomonadota bacterium]|nr:DegT/DnrJ/EryC1/StrS family aminotransferase [Pseudomonadota bacterium]